MLDGKPVLLLCSNNYLGLADHPRVREAAAEAAHALGRRRRRVAPGVGQHDASTAGSRSGWPTFKGTRGVRCCSARATWPTPASSPRSRARATSSSPTSSTTPRSSTAAGSPRAETFVYDHGDVEHLAWGLREAEGRGALIVTDGVFSMDGDVAPLAEIVELARRHDARVMVDEAHGTGALGPGGRGAVAEAGLEDEVDVIVGTLGKALGSYGAYVVLRRAMARVPGQHRAHADLLDRAAAARGGRRAGGARRCSRSSRGASTSCRRNAATCCATRCAARASTSAARRPRSSRWSSATPTHAMRVVRGGARAAACSPRRSGRRPCPTGTSRLRLAVMASHTRGGAARGRRAASCGRAAAGSRPAAPPPPRAPRPRAPDGAVARRRALDGATSTRAVAAGGPACAACFVTGTDTGVGKTVVAGAIAAALRARGERGGARSSRWSPASTRRPRPAGRPTTSCWPRPPGRAAEDVAPHRFGPPVSPHLAAELAGDDDRPGRAAGGARAARRRGRRRARRRGRRRPARPAHARLPRARPRAATSACRSWSPRAPASARSTTRC